MKKLLFLSLILSFNFVYSQNDTIKNQIVMDFSKYTKLFNSQSQFYEIMYLRQISPNNILRTSFSYNQISGDEKKLDFSINIGYARVFKKYSKWRFYTGIDLINTYSSYNNGKKEQYQNGASIFIGAKYYINNHFSISTEPAILGIYNQSYDNGDVPIDKRKEWNEFGLRNLGQLQVCFQY